MPKTKSKVVTSINKKPLSKPMMILVILLIVIASVAIGWNVYQTQRGADLEAKAASWKEIKPLSIERNGGDGVKFVGCREYLDIGPDSAQGKRVKVTILASKPKSLKWQKGKAKQPRFSMGYYSSDRGSITGNDTSSWWNDELAIAQVTSAKVGDKLEFSVESDQSVKSAYYDLGFDADYQVTGLNSNTKRIYYDFLARESFFKSTKEYNKTKKSFNRNLLSVAKLPNCN